MSLDMMTGRRERTGMAKMAKVTVVSVVEAVTNDLRERVLSGRLAPSTPLVEVEIAVEYDVARPTAKAAISNLVHEGLLERRAHRTARVVELSPADVHDVYRAREVIEVEVVRELARRRFVPDAARIANDELTAVAHGASREIVEPDIRFHRSLVDAFGSPRISRAYAALESEVVLCMAHVQGASLVSAELIAAEHGRLVDLVDRGEGDSAAELLSVHLRRASDRLAERLESERAPNA